MVQEWKLDLDVFDLRERLVRDYRDYTRSFIKIRDPRIEAFVDSHLAGEGFWPEPLLQLNPNFAPGGTIDDLVGTGALHKECAQIFRIEKTDNNHRGKQLHLHRHQREAIVNANEGQSYVLTTGTGSGKSLAYIVPIVDHVLRAGSGNGVQAIIVYPMNALANSQEEELAKFLHFGYPEGQPQVRFARFTRQEKGERRERIRSDPPDILLTNYMMLELMLTRWEDRELVRAATGLKFLVFDEIHTYRGRQGADVAMLIRRCRQAFGDQAGGTGMLCIGTSATMASEGTSEQQREAVAKVSQTLFGVEFSSQQVIGETLERATPEEDRTIPATRTAVQDAIVSRTKPPNDYESFHRHPLASWIESTFGVRKEQATGQLVRQTPRRLTGGQSASEESAAEELANFAGAKPDQCAHALREWLKQGTKLYRTETSRFPIFAFRLHQFLTRGDTVWATLEPESSRHLEVNKKAAKPTEPEKPLYPLALLPTMRNRLLSRGARPGKWPGFATAEGGPPRRDSRRRRTRLLVYVRGGAMAGRSGSGIYRPLAHRIQGNHSKGQGASPQQLPQVPSDTCIRRAHGTQRARRTRNASRVHSRKLPILPGTDMRSSVHRRTTIRTVQARHPGRGQPEYRDNHSRGAFTHRAPA